jgi:hypothetical protein
MAVVADEIASGEYGITLDSLIRPHHPHPRLQAHRSARLDTTANAVC